MPFNAPATYDLEGRICALEETIELLAIDVQDTQARLQWPCLDAKFLERLSMCEARLGLGLGSVDANVAASGRALGVMPAYCDGARTDALQHDVAELGEAVESLKAEDLAGRFEELRHRVTATEAGLALLEAQVLGLEERTAQVSAVAATPALELHREVQPREPKVDSSLGQEPFDRLRGEIAAFSEALALRSSVSALEEKAAHALAELGDLAQRVSRMEATSRATVEAVTQHCKAAVERFRDSERILQEAIARVGGINGTRADTSADSPPEALVLANENSGQLPEALAYVQGT